MRGSGDRIATSIPVTPRAGATLRFDLIIGNGTGTGGNGADNAEAGKDIVLEYSVDGQHWDVLKTMDTDDYEAWSTVTVELPERVIVPLSAVDEGDAAGSIAISIVRSGNLEKTASAQWQLVPTGTYPVDFDDLGLAAFPSGTVDFAIGDDVETVVIPIAGDSILEADETFELVLTAADSGPVTGNSRIGTLLNDDEPEVEAVIVNDGSVQRSAIRKLEVQFTGLVDVSTEAVTLTYLGTESSPANQVVVGLLVNVIDEGTATKVRVEVPGGGSLIDGNYRLDIEGSDVLARFGGWAMSGDYAFGDEAVDNFYRKFGDVNGNRVVDLLDFAEFRRAFGLTAGQLGYRGELDEDGDDSVGLLDFAAFRRNFGT